MKRKGLGIFIVVALALALTGCGAKSNPPSTAPAPQPFPFDTMAGTWTGTATVTSPGDPVSQSQMNMTVTFNTENNTVTTIFSANPQFDGTCQASLTETSADYSTSLSGVGWNVEWYGDTLGAGFPFIVQGTYTPSTNTVTGTFTLQSQAGCDIYDGSMYADVLSGTLTITKEQ